MKYTTIEIKKILEYTIEQIENLLIKPKKFNIDITNQLYILIGKITVIKNLCDFQDSELCQSYTEINDFCIYELDYILLKIKYLEAQIKGTKVKK